MGELTLAPPRCTCSRAQYMLLLWQLATPAWLGLGLALGFGQGLGLG